MRNFELLSAGVAAIDPLTCFDRIASLGRIGPLARFRGAGVLSMRECAFDKHRALPTRVVVPPSPRHGTTLSKAVRAHPTRWSGTTHLPGTDPPVDSALDPHSRPRPLGAAETTNPVLDRLPTLRRGDNSFQRPCFTKSHREVTVSPAGRGHKRFRHASPGTSGSGRHGPSVSPVTADPVTTLGGCPAGCPVGGTK